MSDGGSRTPPANVEAEQAVLGGLMLSSDAWSRVNGKLTDADFSRRDHQLLFRAIGELADKNKPCDAVTLGDWLESQGIAQLVGGTGYILKLANATPSAANITAYADIVRDKSQLRQAIEILNDACAACWEKDASGAGAVDSAIGQLMAIANTNTSGHECTIGEATKRAFERLQKVYAKEIPPGLTTGLIDLDAKLGGLHEGDFVVIGGRPSMGKTALLLGMANRAAAKGAPVGLISGEQPSIQVGARALSSYARVSGSRLRTGEVHEEEWPRFATAMSQTHGLPVYMLDRSGPDIREVVRVARKWKVQYGIKALYVDYLQRLTTTVGEKRLDQVGHIARQLKNLARDLEIPVVALGQVGRHVEQRSDKRPRMADLSDSGEIEKEADQVMLLYRDEYYNPETAKAGVAELIVDKNRHGATGFIKLAWREHIMEFDNFSGGDLYT